MCSIIGCAGPIHQLSSKLRREFHDFLSCLFTMAELRGRDAAGFWVWRNDHYVYQKRAVPAENLIQRSPAWKGLRFNPGSLYLLHTRAATDGDPNDMINNHPHVGDHSVVIHNGMIWGHEAMARAEGLTLKSDCDSEILLRLAESRDILREGIKHMYQVTGKSTSTDSIACAFVDRRSPDRILVSKNNGSPCVFYRSERFNCTFFVSTELIFERALDHMYSSKSPKVIGAQVEVGKPFYMYELLDTGKLISSHLVTLQSRYSQGFNPPYYDDEEDDETPTIEYVKTTFMGQPMAMNILGYMEPLNGSEEEEKDNSTAGLVDKLVDTLVTPDEMDVLANHEPNGDEDDLGFTAAPAMPTAVLQNLLGYLDEKLGLEE